MLKTAFSIIILLAIVKENHGQDTLSGPRDPWKWPFSQHSIWNQPIGSDAIYVDAGLEEASHVGVDIQHILELSDSNPARDVLGTEVWGPGRCEGMKALGFTLPIPDNWTVPDAGESPYGLTPNSNFAFRLPNSDIVFEGPQVTRCLEGGAVYMPLWMQYPNNRSYQSITGNGLEGGGQGASGMSSLGGTLRLGELIGERPIRHAIKINPWGAKYCYYHDTLPGYKWPARSADNYAEIGYGGTDPNIVMGSLFAIPPTIDVDSIGLTTEAGRKLFFTMQNYGVYFTEDAAWDAWDMIVERDAEIEFETTYGFSMSSETWRIELNKLMKALSVVTNNSPNQIGGGGIPLQPLAPGFEAITSISDHSIQTEIRLFPNPLEGDFLNVTDFVSIEIYDLQGRLLANHDHANKLRLSLKPGIYLVRISGQDHFFTRKLIKY